MGVPCSSDLAFVLSASRPTDVFYNPYPTTLISLIVTSSSSTLAQIDLMVGSIKDIKDLNVNPKSRKAGSIYLNLTNTWKL